jgi:hypothetical protein
MKLYRLHHFTFSTVKINVIEVKKTYSMDGLFTILYEDNINSTIYSNYQIRLKLQL